MTDHESQPVLTRQLAAECDMLRLRSAAHERTEAELRRENADLRISLSSTIGEREYHKQTAADALRLAGDAIEASKAKQEGIDNLREQVKQLKESLRLVGQMRRADG